MTRNVPTRACVFSVKRSGLVVSQKDAARCLCPAAAPHLATDPAASGATDPAASGATDPAASDAPAGDIQRHLHDLLALLGDSDTLRMAVRLESSRASRYRYLAVVACGHSVDQCCVLGIDCDSRATSIGLVCRLTADIGISLDGDGGIVMSDAEKTYTFKPVSVQAMWSTLQILHGCCASRPRPSAAPRPDWVTRYQSAVSSSQSCLNEWHAVTDTKFRRPESPDLTRPCERRATEQMLAAQLRRIMVSVDLDQVSMKYLVDQLADRCGGSCVVRANRAFIDDEVINILGQLNRASRVFDHILLGSVWNASDIEDLNKNGVGYILNTTREVDNFFPNRFRYMNVRVSDEKSSELLKYWDNTYKFIERARRDGSRVLVHCHMGISRSASVVVAYAMKAYGWSHEEALYYVKQRRASVRPNAGFVKQLETYQGILSASKQRHKWLSHSSSETRLKPPSEHCASAARPAPAPAVASVSPAAPAITAAAASSSNNNNSGTATTSSTTAAATLLSPESQQNQSGSAAVTSGLCPASDRAAGCGSEGKASASTISAPVITSSVSSSGSSSSTTASSTSYSTSMANHCHSLSPALSANALSASAVANTTAAEIEVRPKSWSPGRSDSRSLVACLESSTTPSSRSHSSSGGTAAAAAAAVRSVRRPVGGYGRVLPAVTRRVLCQRHDFSVSQNQALNLSPDASPASAAAAAAAAADSCSCWPNASPLALRRWRHQYGVDDAARVGAPAERASSDNTSSSSSSSGSSVVHGVQLRRCGSQRRQCPPSLSERVPAGARAPSRAERRHSLVARRTVSLLDLSDSGATVAAAECGRRRGPATPGQVRRLARWLESGGACGAATTGGSALLRRPASDVGPAGPAGTDSDSSGSDEVRVRSLVDRFEESCAAVGFLTLQQQRGRPRSATLTAVAPRAGGFVAPLDRTCLVGPGHRAPLQLCSQRQLTRVFSRRRSVSESAADGDSQGTVAPLGPDQHAGCATTGHPRLSSAAPVAPPDGTQCQLRSRCHSSGPEAGAFSTPRRQS